jgi:hypothetical protein
VPNKVTLAIRDFAMSVLEDPTYRANLTRRAIRGRLHPSVEVQLYHYAYGRPKMSFEIEPPGAAVPCFIMPEGTKVAIE